MNQTPSLHAQAQAACDRAERQGNPATAHALAAIAAMIAVLKAEDHGDQERSSDASRRGSTRLHPGHGGDQGRE